MGSLFPCINSQTGTEETLNIMPRKAGDLYVTQTFYRLESQVPTITSAPSSPVQVVEGESVTLEWTYNTGGSAFQEAELRSQGFAVIVTKTAGASTIIVPAFYGRLTANITETNASITFLAVNRSDSRTYDFVVVNQAFRTALQQFTMDVQCKSTFFKYPFSVCDGGLSLLETVRNPANAYQSARKHLSSSDN